MASDSIRKFILNAIADIKKAEPYSLEERNQLDGGIFSISDDAVPFDRDRWLATLSQSALDKYFSKHPEDSIENYINETA